MALKPYTGQFTAFKPYDGDIEPLEEPGLLGEGVNALRSGLRLGRSSVREMAQSGLERLGDLAIGALTGRMPDDDGTYGAIKAQEGANFAKAGRVAAAEREAQRLDTPSASTTQGLREISEADGPLEATKAIVSNPRAVAMTTAKSMGISTPSMIAGAVAGAAGGGPVGAAAAVGGGSGMVEYESTLRDTMAEAGVDLTDEQQVFAALQNQELMAKAKDRATKRGLVVGTFDALTAGLAGRLLGGARSLPAAARRTAGELGLQAGGGAAGEATGQLTTEGRVNKWGDVGMEAFSEVPTTITEVPTNYRRAREAFRQREADKGMVQSDYRSLAEQHGATITSLTRTPEKNRRVHGVANSQHLRGTAGDFVLPPERKAAFKAQASAMGYEVIDEGNHIHLELPSGKAGQTTLAGRRSARRAQVDAGEMTRGTAAAEDAIDAARERRGLQTPERKPTEAPHLDDLIRRANDPSLPPEDRRAAKSEAQRLPQRRVSEGIEVLKNQMLDKVAQQSLDTSPPPASDITAEQPAPVSLPEPQTFQSAPQTFESTANQPAQKVATPPAPQPTPEAPQPPFVTPPAPQVAPPAAPVAPPAQPQAQPEATTPLTNPPSPPGRPNTDWKIGRREHTNTSAVIARGLNRGGLASIVHDTPLTENDVFEVEMVPEQQKRIDQLGKVLGRRIVLFDIGDTVNNQHGVVGMAVDAKHVFVNVGAVQQGYSMTAVIGHEFTHTLRHQGSKLLEELIAYTKGQINLQSSYVLHQLAAYSQAYAPRGYTKEQMADAITEELVADFIGDLLNDEQFWAELAQQEPNLFKRLLSALIRFLGKMADKARRLSAPDAFEDIEGMRRQAVAIMREHLRDPMRPATGKPGDAKAALGGDDRTDLVRERATQMAHSHFERGDYMSAAMESARASATDSSPAMPIETPEQRAFFKDAGPHAKQDSGARVFFHGKVSGKPATVLRPNAGNAVFVAQNAHFATPYAAVGYRRQEKLGRIDVIVDGRSMQEQLAEHRSGSPDRVFAELMLLAEGDLARAYELLPDYLYGDQHGDPVALDDDTNDKVVEMLEQLGSMQDENPSVIQTQQRQDFTGMSIVPLVTNVKSVWDFHNPHHVKRLVEALRDKFGTLQKMRDAMKMKHGFSDWAHVASSLSNPGSNWTLIEDLGADIPGLIKEMGFDAYTVSEEGHTNLAVYNPRQLKSLFGNVGSWGQRAPTAEEAASLGMTLEEALLAQEAGDIRLSLGSVMAKTFTNGLYTHENRAQLERWLADEFRDLREVQKAIAASQFGGTLPPGMDAHRYENLRHGAYQDKRAHADRSFIKPIAKLITGVDGADLEGFSRFLWWRHAGERDAYLRSKADPSLNIAPDGLAGISPADAQAAIAALDPQVRSAYERAATHIDRMRAFTLKTLLDSGQITRDHYNTLLRQYQHYVPLRGMPDGSEELNGKGGRGLSMNAKPVGPRAAGRRTEPSNIIEEMMRDLDLALIGEQKQIVLDAVVRLIAAHPDPDLWEVQPVKAERKWVGGVLTVVQTNGEAQDQITFMHRGVPVKIEIRHAGLRKALLNLQEPMPKWLRSLGRVTRWLSAVKTSFSPFFLLINPVRDVSFAVMAVGAEHGAATIKSMAEFYPHTYGALRVDDATSGGGAQRYLQRKGASATRLKTQQYAREFSAAGGKVGYTYVNDIREQQKKLRNMIARHAQSKGLKDIAAGNFHTKDAGLLARKAQQHIANLFEVANDMAENSTRLAVYCALREQGWSIEDAAAYAKEVTVNFNRRGSFSKVLGSFYMFFNAAMQGGVRMGKLMKNPKFAGTMGGMVLASYTMALSQMFAAGDDDDGESNYDKAISDSQAQRSIGIYLGDGKSLALPVPYGPNIATYLGYRAAKLTYDQMRGRNPSVGTAAGDIATQALMSMSPLDPGRGWSAFVPEFGRVPLQAAMNKSDFGGKLNSKLMGTREEALMPRFDKTDARTGAPYLWAAQALNTVSGGTDYTPGAVNWTGEQTRYVAEQMGGGLLRLGTETWELVENKLAGIDPEPSDVPLANVYFRGRGDRRHAASYYENTEDFERSVKQWQKAVANDDEAALNAILKHAPWIEGAELSASTKEGREAQSGTVMEAKRDTDRAIKALRKEQADIRADKTLDWKERKRLLRQIDVEIAGYQKDFNAAINAGRGVRGMQQ